MIRIAPHVWGTTIETLRACGERGVECVVYWTAALDTPDDVDDVAHGGHRSTPWSYELREEWLQSFLVGLHKARRLIRAQVHTHEGAAFHSKSDDRWPIVHMAGFLSLVVPRFARGEARDGDLFLVELTASGWIERTPSSRIGGLP